MAQTFFESQAVPPVFAIDDLLHRMQIFFLINTSASLNLRCLGSSNSSPFILHDSRFSSVAAAPSPLAIQEDCHASEVIR